MSSHTYIAFYLPKHGGKFHLPYWGTAISEDHAACRLTTMVKTGINDHRVYSTVADIRDGKHSHYICGRCARIAVSRAEEVN